ncbi:MAG: NAD(P)H-dependent oxidoreductase [Candidatus Altimarinota bacterium]
MHKLIVTAHPSSNGFTHKIAEKIATLSKEKGDSVEIFDLYKTELTQDFLRFEDPKAFGDDATTKKIQEKILSANELIFIFPIWWGDAPAILKNFIDCNFRSGFAFRYENGKPVGLLKGKTARIIATSGGPAFFYKLFLHIQLLWNLNRISFCGIKQKSFTVFGNMEDPKTDKEAHLKALEKLV